MPGPINLPPLMAYLVEAAGYAPSADNSQPWCFEWDGEVLTGRAVQRGGFPVDYHATVMALGAAAENLFTAANSLGLDLSSWVFRAPGPDGVFIQGRLLGQEKIAGFPENPIWKQRHTNRLPYLPEINSLVLPEIKACHVGQASVNVATGAEIKNIAAWVRQASEVRFQTREVNEWFASSLRYGSAPQDLIEGLNVKTLALPPAGVSLLKLMSNWNRMKWLNRFKIYKLFAQIEAINFQKTPLLIAIVGSTEQASIFDAGRCLQKVWLKITELGLSAHPYYVVADLLGRVESGGVPLQCMRQAGNLKKQVQEKFGSERTLHCLMRVGTPSGKIEFSGRLPIDEIMCKASIRS